MSIGEEKAVGHEVVGFGNGLAWHVMYVGIGLIAFVAHPRVHPAFNESATITCLEPNDQLSS